LKLKVEETKVEFDFQFMSTLKSPFFKFCIFSLIGSRK